MESSDHLHLMPDVEVQTVVDGPERPIIMGSTPHFFQGAEHFQPGQDPLKNLVRPHVDSFDFFLQDGLTAAVSQVRPITIAGIDGLPRTVIRLAGAEVSKPMQDASRGLPRMPSVCREAGLTYAAPLNATFEVSVENGPVHTITRSMGDIPIMVGSSRCHLRGLTREQLVAAHEEPREAGGYFIINGNERLVRLLVNGRRHYPFALDRPSYRKRGSNFSTFGVTMRSVRPDETSTTLVLHYLKDGSATLRVLLNKGEYFIPFVTVMKALVETSDREIFNAVVGGDTSNVFVTERIQMMLRDAHAAANGRAFTRADCCAHLGAHFRHMLSHIPADATDAQAGEIFLRDCIFPHLSPAGSKISDDGMSSAGSVEGCGGRDKFNLLCVMLRKLYALAGGAIRPDNPDSATLQEVLLPGQVYLGLCKEKLEDALFSARNGIIRETRLNPAHANIADLSFVARVFERYSQDIGRALSYFIATGNVRSRTGLDLLQISGMTIVAEKLNFLRYLAHFRSIHRGAFFQEMRTTTVRKLLPDSWGFICPVHTPDGGPIGLLQHLTHTCSITTTQPDASGLPAVLATLGMLPIGAGEPAGTADTDFAQTKDEDNATAAAAAGASASAGARQLLPVNIDGRIAGHIRAGAGAEAARQLRLLKTAGHPAVPSVTEIVFVGPEQVGHMPAMHIFTGRCRFTRPVVNLQATAAAAAATAADPATIGRVVETIGSLEQIFMDVAVVEDDVVPSVTTHQEVYPTAFLSVIAAMTPFSDYNQSPRCLYQCQMAKQTMGTPYLSVPHRTDNKTYRVVSPQRALVSNVIQREYGLDDYPNGTNAVVAVISYTSYDMEDACIINKQALERGLFRGIVWTIEDFILFDPTRRAGRGSLSQCTQRFGNWRSSQQIDPETNQVVSTAGKVVDSLGEDGLPAVGQRLRRGDPVCVIYDSMTDRHIVKKFSKAEEAVVEEIRIVTTFYDKEPRHLRIKYRFDRTPVIGDKFSSRHGQKGTLSLPWPHEDMPFTGQGIVPDLIINPHAFPSRMTIGMLIESMAGKAGAAHGVFQDATPFQFSEKPGERAIDFFAEQLAAAGFDRFGNEVLYAGTSGREIVADVFIGSVYYQRLRHMVKDKFQVRATGAMNQLTRQPVKGRKRGGGVRFGEMERDSLISHGVAFTLQDRLFKSSDYHVTDVCKCCGGMLGVIDAVEAEAAGHTTRRKRCLACVAAGRDGADIARLQVPYVYTYLAAELAGLGIRVGLDVKSVVDESA